MSPTARSGPEPRFRPAEYRDPASESAGLASSLVAVDLDESFVADPEVVRDLVEDDALDEFP